MAFITMVKSVTRQGNTSQKSLEVENHLASQGLINLVDRIVIAQEGDLTSEGMRLAEIYQVDRTPFFLVADEAGGVSVYNSYAKFLQEALLPEQKKVMASQRRVA